MGLSSLSLFIFMALFSLTHSSPPMQMQPLCHGDDSSALLQFRQSFFFTLPVLASWTLELNKSDCCSWDGVECDDNTGRVIGLDLSSSGLFGSISSTSSLFRLVHLQRLNLAHNDFRYSSIPPQVRNLSRLTHLNLSRSNFSGEIPLEISQLSQLSSLDLSYSLLELKKVSLRTLAGNLTHLQELDLRWVDIHSTVPNILANFSSLTFLCLSRCGLHGEFPIGIFKLSNLRYLSMYGNEGLTGYLPSFTWSSPLQTLDLTGISFSGELSASMGNLSFLTFLSIEDCNFSGSIPSSLGNLTKLTYLILSNNTFMGNIPHSLGNLVQLSFLRISWTQLTGQVPFRLVNLPQLSYLDLSYNLLSGEIKLENETRLTIIGLNNNQLTGPITFGPMTLTNLQVLDLACNKFHGQISNSIFSFKNLEVLYLFENYFNGTLEFDEFLKLKHLYALDISGNQLSLLIKETSANATLQKFQDLGFSSCNLSEVPNFIRNQHELKNLNLSNNKIQSQVPEWMWNTSTTSLEVLDLSNNLLAGFSQHPILFPWTHLRFLDLRSNLLQGSLPTPPISTSHFYISNNLLIGNIPESFCNLSSLQVLDLANNNLSASLPRCSDNFGDSLLVLNLRMNKFQGSIPETWIRGRQLGIINFSQNKFQGQLPRLLAECTMLTVLDLSENQFNDTFPFWLGDLPNLKVLRLRSNKFNGPMEMPQTYSKFLNIRILDISYNDFMGKLPLRLFENWKAKKLEDEHMLTYIHENLYFQTKNSVWYARTAQAYTYSMVMTNKGNDVFYEKVQEVFIAIDLSSNRFVGEIPESIGNLNGAQLLNLSNNVLTGQIPSFLGNLTKLEALDLSQNKLLGEIPQQLTQLTFLAVFNVSHNNLMGLIPQGKQFDTFENSSFEGNPRLCGRPLPRKCENSNEPPSQPSISHESQDYRSPFEFGWKIVAIGYGFGFVVGVIIGRIVIARKHDWLMKTLRIRPLGGRRCKNEIK